MPKPLHVDDVLRAELPEPTPKSGAIAGDPHEALLQLFEDDRVQIGIWECSPGSFPSARDGYSELMVFFAGEATITDDDGTRHPIGPGTVMRVPDGWRGSWEIRDTVRKVYVIMHTEPGSS